MNRFPAFAKNILRGHVRVVPLPLRSVLLGIALATVAAVVSLVLLRAQPAAAIEPTYQPGPLWAGFFCVGSEQCGAGDFDGDGRADIVTFLRDTQSGDAQADVYVALSNGYSFSTAQRWHDSLCAGQDICKIADVNGDHRDDVIVFKSGSDPSQTEFGRVYVAVSMGTFFGALVQWNSRFCVGYEVCEVGDFNGDGLADIAAFTRSAYESSDIVGRVWVALSSGSAFVNGAIWRNSWFCVGQEQCGVGDFNGDSRDDVVAFAKSNYSNDADGDVWVALSSGSAFGSTSKWSDFFCLGSETCAMGDFNNDNREDAITFLRSNYSDKIGDVMVSLSTGGSLSSGAKWQEDFCRDSLMCTTGDFNGDDRDDIISFVRSTYTDDRQGDVYVALSAWPKAAFDYLKTNTYLPLLLR